MLHQKYVFHQKEPFKNIKKEDNCYLARLGERSITDASLATVPIVEPMIHEEIIKVFRKLITLLL